MQTLCFELGDERQKSSRAVKSRQLWFVPIDANNDDDDDDDDDDEIDDEDYDYDDDYDDDEYDDDTNIESMCELKMNE